MEVQIKMTRHLFTLYRWLLLKKRERDTGEDVEKLGSLYMVENAHCVTGMENSIKIPQNS